MTFGLTPQGFRLKRYDEIKLDIETRLNEDLGITDFRANTLLGVFIAILSFALALLWEAVFAVYLAGNPSTATGQALRYLVQLIGLQAIPASGTRTAVTLIGVDGSAVSANTVIQNSLTADLYQIEAATVLNAAEAIEALITVSEVQPSTVYTIVLNGTAYNHTSVSVPTAAGIATALAALLNAISGITSTASAEKITVYADDRKTAFSISVQARLQLSEIGNVTVFEAQLSGSRLCPIGTLTQIQTPQVGLIRATNYTAGDLGRDAEKDEELRLRFRQSPTNLGRGTLSAITSRLRNEVQGVTKVLPFENTSTQTISGRPPKSFEMVVQGGLDADIAAVILRNKPAGIASHGGVTVEVPDSEGDLQQVKFSRPTPKYAWLQVEVTLYNEETYPSNGTDLIAAAALAHGQGLEVGENILLQRFLGPMFAATPGVASFSVEAAVTDAVDGIPSYGTADIAIAETAIALFAAERITVTLA